MSEPPADIADGNLTVEDINREITQAESQVIKINHNFMICSTG